MHVKGFILEDDQGREFVLWCERPYTQIGRKFFLRGWQRRRLIPLQYSEGERRQIVGGVLIALKELIETLSGSLGKKEHDISIGCVNSLYGRGHV